MNTYILEIAGNLKNMEKNEKISLQKDSSCCFSNKYKQNTKKIDVSKLNNILEVKPSENYIVVEPNVSMEQITDYLLNLENGPYMLPVTPEFKHITIGGAVNGLGIESSSCKHGLFENIVLKYELLLTNGELIEVTSHNEYKDLFYSLSGSYGTFGILTKVYLKIVSTEYYVKVNYKVYKSPKEVEYIFKKSEDEFIEGLVFSDKTLVSIAKPVKIGYYDWLFNTSNFNYFFSKWYYNHVKEISDNYSEYTEFIPIKDYLFRWDRGAFWFGSNRLDCTIYNRVLYGSSLTSKKLYERAKRKDVYEREKYKVVQDLLVPLDNMCDLIKEVKSITNIYPIWLCPIKTYENREKSIFSLPNNGKIYVDVGVYGGWEQLEHDFLGKNQVIERLLYDRGGIKFLCNMNYYDKVTFWKIYNKEKYDKLKLKYDSKNNLLNIYDKTCSFFIKYFGSSD